MLPELDSRRQPEFAMEHSMGRQGGARRPRQLCARCVPRCVRAPCLPGALPVSPPPGLPSPAWRLLRGRHGKGSGAPLRGAAPVRAGRLERVRARRWKEDGCDVREDGCGQREASHFGATGALSAKSGACACVSVRVCARV